MPIFELSESDLDNVTGGRVDGPALIIDASPYPYPYPYPAEPWSGGRYDYSAPADQLA